MCHLVSPVGQKVSWLTTDNTMVSFCLGRKVAHIGGHVLSFGGHLSPSLWLTTIDIYDGLLSSVLNVPKLLYLAMSWSFGMLT